ncbi:MAG: M20/M25/M40 family metallo-hydrolase [Candidatus Eisenbacteria bacterium]|nr:M20/M25/M40 family metallo-hydrolase [Candidatus Eisenbacteria bacterium]
MGFEVQRAGDNLFFRAFEAPGPTLLFNSHLDTVPACGGWTREPNRMTRVGDRLYGLGANDAKGCVTALLEAALILRTRYADEGAPGTLWVAFTAQEETGGQGIENVMARLPRPDAAVVGEPTGCRPVLAQKGLLVLKGSARGVAGHAAHAARDGARNAVHMAAADVARLAGFEESGAEVLGTPHPMLGPVTVQVTMISGGHARNAVPDSCDFWVDVRTNPGTDPRALAARIGEGLQSEITVHSARLRAMETPPASAVARAAVEATGCPAEGSRTTSDWVHLGDVPTVKIGPGETSRSHRADEFVTGAELQRGAQVYAGLARRYFAAARKEHPSWQ